MIGFGHRVKLEKMYHEWLKENGVFDRPVSIIAFLQLKGLLNEDKVLEFLKGEKR